MSMASMASDLQATLEADVALRLAIRLDPLKPSYNVHGHQYDWNGAMRVLNEEIKAIRRELAEMSIGEIISRGC
jgi:hypothetical protein